MPKNWSFLPFSNAFKQISIISKIKLKEYKTEGKFPIIDQGENFISGYWNNDDDAIKEIPLIAFGDHTRRFKFISFPFVAGADGLKLFSPLFTTPCFSYYMCLALSFPNKGYARHSSFLKKCIFPVPPLAEQERIVAKIEELFAGIDAGVENLKSVKNQIALYRQSVLKSAFDGTLYKTTEWNIDVLKNLCSVISDGDHQPPPKAKNGIPFIMISNINKNIINFEYTNFVSENYYTSLSEKRKPKWGDVLYSVVGSYGIPVLIDFQKEFCFQRHIALLRPNTNKIFSKFLFYMLRSRNVYNQATDCSTGTAQKTVPLSGLREIHIPVPTLAEQERIVTEIESRFERADALETAVDRALNDAEKLKQAVLKKAFSGELVPQNPDDEPASVLLDRIRAERAAEQRANPKKGKQKR